MRSTGSSSTSAATTGPGGTGAGCGAVNVGGFGSPSVPFVRSRGLPTTFCSCVCGARFKPTERVHDTVKGLMCEVDYSSSLPPCAVCLRGVPEEDALLVAGKYFHRSCFKCQVRHAPRFDLWVSSALTRGGVPSRGDCGWSRGVSAQICFKPVVGDVYEDKGSVQCENCFFKARDLICVECTRPIKTEYVQFTNKKRHVECFNCSFCRKRITANNAMMQKNKLYCLDCGSKLHG